MWINLDHHELNDRIEFNPNILAGKAIIKGTRLSVEFILELLSNEWSYDSIIENYPHITKEDILACIDYARMRIKEEIVHPVKV